jgi:hypothetical protein
MAIIAVFYWAFSFGAAPLSVTIFLFCFYRVGTVALADYMTFMISRETENVSSIDDVVLAFKSLTENSERPYITRDELYAVRSFFFS